MPRVEIMEPFGFCYTISTRQTETTLFAWFDEVLPYCWVAEVPGTTTGPIWPRIRVWPMWAWTSRHHPVDDADWFTDSWVMRAYEFPARNGAEGLAELAKLRQQLEQELKNHRRTPR